ncbi:plantaricin C family lantibiotic [Nocardiopsis sp. NPDC050513]|uniref:plantaricin C family lantibiotic n=1 Tax=Nocardiopsis sp. NPDC050513 TaxID=3364338 RepID=UPI00378C0D7E
MSEMNASIFEEIQEQNLDDIVAGDVAPDSISVTVPWIACAIASRNNTGLYCTVTLECNNPGSVC